MRRLTLLVLCISTLSFVSAFAQDDADPAPGPWKTQFDLGLNLSQSAFSNNWNGGDKGTINWVMNGDLKAERQVNETLHWANQLQLAYGQTSTQALDGSGKKAWSQPDKTTDLILFESVGRLDFHLWVEPYLAFRLDSQFIDESNPIGGLLFNPVKLTETGGVARVFQKDEDRELISRFGFGFRQSMARNYVSGGADDETERFTTHDGGFEFQTQAVYPMWDNAVVYKGKLLLFMPVFFSGSSDLESFDSAAALVAGAGSRESIQDFWSTPDVNWQNTFTAQITKYLAVNLYVQFVYDKFDEATNIIASPVSLEEIAQVDAGVRKGGQFKQTLALGITYRLF